MRPTFWRVLQRRVDGFKGAADNAEKKTLKYKERDPRQCVAYLQQLRCIIQERGSANIVCVDEVGSPPRRVAVTAGASAGGKFTVSILVVVGPEPA